MKLPTNAMNMFLNDGFSPADDSYVLEIAIPGLAEPENVTATLHECKKEVTGICCQESKCNCTWKCVMLRGKAFSNEASGNVAVYRIAEFEKHLKVPYNAVDPIPTITITVARDNCNNITEGFVTVEWKIAVASIPIEIKECK